jgi:hypothetical protein
LYAFQQLPQRDSKAGLLQHLADEGTKIGLYSRLLYPDGVLIPDGPTHDMVNNTKSLLESSSSSLTVFEAAVQSGSCFIRADILQKMENSSTLHLAEVKSKSWDSGKSRDELLLGKRSGIKSEFLPYLQDVAFQKLVISQAYPEYFISKCSLILPDKAKVNTKIPNLNGLFHNNDISSIWLDQASRDLILGADEMLVTEVDVTDLVEHVLDTELKVPGGAGGSLREVVAEWAYSVENGTLSQPPPIGSQCRDCEFRTRNDGSNGLSGFAICWNEAAGLQPEEQNGLIVDLYHGGKTTEKLISQQKYFMSDVEPHDIGLSQDGTDEKKKDNGMSRSERQWYQVSQHDSVVVDRNYLLKEMEVWHFPLHFIDFETVSTALPFFVHKHPFDVIAFQFSHHMLHQDGSVEHASEFLHTIPGECPNTFFLHALAKNLQDTKGTIFRWGSHENTVLATVLQSYKGDSNDCSFLESLLDSGERAMVDLMRLVTKGYYVPGSNASSSIKNLLLPTMSVSKRLKDIYSSPTYSSNNFTDMQWWKRDMETGNPYDPYSLLNEFDRGEPVVSHGGDAIVAYCLLQQANLESRSELEASLLRYCELDTLAMVMIMQALQEMVDEAR